MSVDIQYIRDNLNNGANYLIKNRDFTNISSYITESFTVNALKIYYSDMEFSKEEHKSYLRDSFERSGLSAPEYIALTCEAISASKIGASQANINPSLATQFTQITSVAVLPKSDISLPKVAPELYQDRKRPESPIAFYDRVWRQYESAGLYQDVLRRYDVKLIPAIHTYCSRHRLNAKDHLPPPRQERAKRELHAKVLTELQIESGLASQFESVAQKPLALPEVAPELYAGNRGGGSKGENIIDFLRRVWMPWIEAGVLTRPDLKRLDKGAYVGLGNWLRNNELPADIAIPKKSEVLDAKIAAADSAHDLMRVGHAIASRLRRSEPC
jgi:hypothetical protein